MGDFLKIVVGLSGCRVVGLSGCWNKKGCQSKTPATNEWTISKNKSRNPLRGHD